MLDAGLDVHVPTRLMALDGLLSANASLSQPALSWWWWWWWWWWYHSLTAHQHQMGHTVPKQVIMIATLIQVATVLRIALCESIRYQAKSEQNVRQDHATGKLLSCTPALSWR